MTSKKCEIQKVHCNKCLQDTNHVLVASKKHSGNEHIDDPNFPIHTDWSITNEMLECRGCENVVLKRTICFSEWDEDDIKFFPPPISRQLPHWHANLPQDWTELIEEVYTALHADSRRLALMGARALVDLYMNYQLDDIGGFQQKLVKLESERLISKPNKEFLEAALETGHAATHRGYKASVNEVSRVMDIVENLLQTHVLRLAAEDLKKKTPARQNKAKKQA